MRMTASVLNVNLNTNREGSKSWVISPSNLSAIQPQNEIGNQYSVMSLGFHTNTEFGDTQSL